MAVHRVDVAYALITNEEQDKVLIVRNIGSCQSLVIHLIRNGREGVIARTSG